MSDVAWKMAPALISSRRSVIPFDRLPLCAIANPPVPTSAKSGCTLRSTVSPDVE